MTEKLRDNNGLKMVGRTDAPAPEAGALPGCATLRHEETPYLIRFLAPQALNGSANKSEQSEHKGESVPELYRKAGGERSPGVLWGENQADKNNLAYIGKKPGSAKRDSDAWFTPKHYVELVRGALGGTIDFDPFSDPVAQQTVRAGRFYSVEDDALSTPWPNCSTVFMNPPYSKGMCALAIQAFIDNFDRGRFKRGIVLVNNATDTTWWANLTRHSGCAGLCLTHGRISFENADGKAISGNTRGQAFVLFQGGPHKKRDALEQFKRYFDHKTVGKVLS